MAVVIRLLFAALLPVFVFVSPVTAQDQTTPLRVATRVLPPFVVMEKGQLSGFSIDLWNDISARLKIKTGYLSPSPDVRSLLQTVRDGKADVAISAVSITAERNQEYDFSQPMMNAGLQILVRGKGQAAEARKPTR